VLETQAKLGARAMGRKAMGKNGVYELRGSQTPYSHVSGPKKCALSPKTAIYGIFTLKKTK